MFWGFNPNKMKEQMAWSDTFLIFFIATFFLNLNIGCHNKGKIVLSRMKVFWNYYEKLLCFDLWCIFVMLFNAILYSSGHSANEIINNKHLFRTFVVLNCTIIFKLTSIWKLTKNVERELNLIGFKY